MLCATLSAPGQSFALGLYMAPVADSIQATRVEVATIYAAATLAAAFVLPFVGRIADRTSSRVFLSCVVALIGVSVLLFSVVGSLLATAMAFFVLRLLGQGATGLGVLTTVVRWFQRNRGRAAAVAVLGYALGELVMPIIIVQLQQSLGWRGSLVALGSAYLMLFAPLVLLVVRSPRSPETDQDCSPIEAALPSVTASQAMRTVRFWVLAALVSVTPFVLTGLFINHITLFASIGWTPMDVARALQGYALANLGTTYAVGALLDARPAKVGLIISMGLLVLALLVPLGTASALLGVPLYGLLLGGAAGATNATHGVLWAEQFGVGSVGAIKGTVSSVRNGATAAAAPLAALLSGRGGFSWVLAAGLLIAIVAGIGALLLPSSRPVRSSRVGEFE